MLSKALAFHENYLTSTKTPRVSALPGSPSQNPKCGSFPEFRRWCRPYELRKNMEKTTNIHKKKKENTWNVQEKIHHTCLSFAFTSSFPGKSLREELFGPGHGADEGGEDVLREGSHLWPLGDGTFGKKPRENWKKHWKTPGFWMLLDG